MKGIYILILAVEKDICVNVGALGKVNFENGLYAYVGSARNNLEMRVKRHLSKNKKRFWHIDYLLGNGSVKVHKVLSSMAERSEECEIAKRLSRKGFAVEGFGCSDCNCKSHLFKLRDYELLSGFTHESAT
jgi:Uri superfamily endonuclease